MKEEGEDNRLGTTYLAKCADHNATNMYTNKHDLWLCDGKFKCGLCEAECGPDDGHPKVKAIFRETCKQWHIIKTSHLASLGA